MERAIHEKGKLIGAVYLELQEWLKHTFYQKKAYQKESDMGQITITITVNKPFPCPECEGQSPGQWLISRASIQWECLKCHALGPVLPDEFGKLMFACLQDALVGKEIEHNF